MCVCVFYNNQTTVEWSVLVLLYFVVCWTGVVYSSVWCLFSLNLFVRCSAICRNVDKELFFKHVVEMSETHVLNGEKMNPQLDMLLDEVSGLGEPFLIDRQCAGV